ncbi:MAG: Maf-like protein [Clostridiaceae bacterium]
MINTILASASPRRKELLSRITSEFQVVVSNFDEDTVAFSGDVEKYVMEIAKGKALDVAKQYKEDIVIGCDTVVVYENKVLGKPKDKIEAYDMLKMLSDRTHFVYSGLFIIDTKRNIIRNNFEKTEVFFSKLTEKDITRYIDTGEPMDKAGAYGIQGKGGIFVKKINGCFYNVMGLPINKLNSMIREMGVNL